MCGFVALRILNGNATISASGKKRIVQLKGGIMAPTIQAILSRFKGDRGRAMDYVISVARAYPHLATEYWQILDILKGVRNA